MMEQLKLLFLQSMSGPVYLVYSSKELMSISLVIPLMYAKQWNTRNVFDVFHGGIAHIIIGQMLIPSEKCIYKYPLDLELSK